MISVGNTIPATPIVAINKNGEDNTTTTELFAGKKVVLFALPGAFTPTCSKSHLPGYVTLNDEFMEKGADMVACLSVNDSFVMSAWAKDQNAENITMLADGGAAFTKALGLDMDTGDFGGVRSKRYAMIIEDNNVKHLNVEAPKEFEVSKAETMLAIL
ncbi:peroxiredoxin [Leucothrix pacifica]|uniref:Glutathione-dependent peroxiredoxin n=1 Tax=Leucothrix pacifica TaxID=1247513 RepID=A0A317CSY9_9GAMM|nr:peroxiredoxin [Leucothrix pacifica]PWQ99442.1 peroxiredoxin [Leucothrix pacifica]